jgi:uncharacterized membrane protein YjgN (DUF898 family)
LTTVISFREQPSQFVTGEFIHSGQQRGPNMARSKAFVFDGGAATYFGTALLAFLVTVLTFGICYPYALVLRQRWKAKHTYVNGHRLVFMGTGISLFGNWLKWLVLSVVTLGIYLLWVVPRVNKWIVEHTDFDPTFSPGPASPSNQAVFSAV